MEFEYDPNKSAANKDKHGIDFEAAQAIWADDGRIEATAISDIEDRFIAVGQINGKHWTAIYTLRRGRVRLISVRRARATEVKKYEQGDS